MNQIPLAEEDGYLIDGVMFFRKFKAGF